MIALRFSQAGITEESAPTEVDWRGIQIEGSVSLMDLEEKTIHSHHGYYCDGWVTVHLEEYV